MLTVIALSSTAFGVSIAGALMPLISVELFVIGCALSGPELPWWLLALVIAAGQLGGKLLYFYAARGVLRLPRWLLRDSSGTDGRWRRSWKRQLRRFKVLCRRHPTWAAVFLLGSALLSLPPFAATAAAAGWARVSLTTFLVTAFVGRYVRFASLAAAPTLALSWLF